MFSVFLIFSLIEVLMNFGAVSVQIYYITPNIPPPSGYQMHQLLYQSYDFINLRDEPVTKVYLMTLTS